MEPSDKRQGEVRSRGHLFGRGDQDHFRDNPSREDWCIITTRQSNLVGTLVHDRGQRCCRRGMSALIQGPLRSWSTSIPNASRSDPETFSASWITHRRSGLDVAP